MRIAILALLAALACPEAQGSNWIKLFNGKNLDGWEVLGDGVWTVLRDGTLVGARASRKTFPTEWPMTRPQFNAWRDNQSWLYTKQEFGEFDLRLEYWLRVEGNSGISIRDTSRAKHAITVPADFKRTPSKIGYEIQLNNNYPDPHPSGSIYTFVNAKTGAQIDNEWNRMEIQSRNDAIRVLINGHLVAEHPGDPARAKTGPIGLQLHDQFSVVKFRNIRLRQTGGANAGK